MTKTVEEIREYHRKYYQEHKQKMLAQAKKWREENADRVIANTHLQQNASSAEHL